MDTKASFPGDRTNNQLRLQRSIIPPNHSLEEVLDKGLNQEKYQSLVARDRHIGLISTILTKRERSPATISASAEGRKRKKSRGYITPSSTHNAALETDEGFGAVITYPRAKARGKGPLCSESKPGCEDG